MISVKNFRFPEMGYYLNMLLNIILMHYGTRKSKAAGKGQKESVQNPEGETHCKKDQESRKEQIRTIRACLYKKEAAGSLFFFSRFIESS
jgi:hypothetical protein